MRKIMDVAVFTLLMLVAAEPCHAKKTVWEKLSDCQYIDAKDNDGDSFRVRCGTKGFVLRLYFVDAPETNLRIADRTREQGEHFGITLDETMRAGILAKELVQKLLHEPFIVQTHWASAQGRSKESRYYAFVETGGKNLAEVLVSQGLARTKGTSSKLPSGEKGSKYKERLELLEHEAQQKRLGAWATSAKQ